MPATPRQGGMFTPTAPLSTHFNFKENFKANMGVTFSEFGGANIGGISGLHLISQGGPIEELKSQASLQMNRKALLTIQTKEHSLWANNTFRQNQSSRQFLNGSNFAADISTQNDGDKPGGPGWI